jgi:hypothetical protein
MRRPVSKPQVSNPFQSPDKAPRPPPWNPMVTALLRPLLSQSPFLSLCMSRKEGHKDILAATGAGH